MGSKPFWTSRLMWLALVEGIFGVIELVADGQVTMADWDAIVLLVSAAATAVFRALTNQAVTFTKGR